MSTAIAIDTLMPMQRGLSNWWTEEAEYVFRRIERWATFARGYNRLRSQRYSHGRLAMTEEPIEPKWNITANKLIVEECGSWNPRSHNLQRSRRRKSRAEETRINCCGTFNYQSNHQLDSPCLEIYRYDHSIYFKTIGDIRNGDTSRKCDSRLPGNSNESSPETNDFEQVEWRVEAVGKIECHQCDRDLKTDVRKFPSRQCKESADFRGIHIDHKCHGYYSKSTKISQVQPIINLTQIDINHDESIRCMDDCNLRDANNTVAQMNDSDDQDGNFGYKNNDNHSFNNCNKNQRDNEIANRNIQQRQSSEEVKDVIVTSYDNMPQWTERPPSSQKQEGECKKMVSIRKTRQSPRKVSQPRIVGENNIVWPGVLLNYKKNVVPVNSPFCHSMKKSSEP